MQDKLIKIGWILMLILGLYRVGVSIILVPMGFGNVASGLTLAATAVAIIGITLGSYRKAEKWSWWCLLGVGIMPLLGCTILYGIDPITLGGWVLFILAIAIPAKAILGQKSSE